MHDERPPYEDTEAVWKLVAQGTSKEYPYMNYGQLARLIRKQLPHITPVNLHAILMELAESRRINVSEGFEPTSELERLFP